MRALLREWRAAVLLDLASALAGSAGSGEAAGRPPGGQRWEAVWLDAAPGSAVAKTLTAAVRQAIVEWCTEGGPTGRGGMSTVALVRTLSDETRAATAAARVAEAVR